MSDSQPAHSIADDTAADEIRGRVACSPRRPVLDLRRFFDEQRSRRHREDGEKRHAVGGYATKAPSK
ncbi:MAG: hypothetical protein ACT452_14935 [Microthrixaceae bacterium]